VIYHDINRIEEILKSALRWVALILAAMLITEMPIAVLKAQRRSVAAVSWRRGFKPARYYLAAWAVFMLGIFMFASNKFGLLPRSLFTENAHLIGVALNTLMLSLALADRINVLRQEKEEMQKQLEELARLQEISTMPFRWVRAET